MQKTGRQKIEKAVGEIRSCILSVEVEPHFHFNVEQYTKIYKKNIPCFDCLPCKRRFDDCPFVNEEKQLEVSRLQTEVTKLMDAHQCSLLVFRFLFFFLVSIFLRFPWLI
jgi:hypothetical protein